MFGTLKRWLGITQEPSAERMMERWSPEKLQEVKEYLESIPKDEWKREDYYLIPEWLVHRYLPADHKMTESEWAAAISVFKSRIDANIERIERGEPPLPRPPMPKREPVEDDPVFGAWFKEQLEIQRQRQAVQQSSEQEEAR